MTTINLGFTEIEIHDSHVVGRTKEGVHLDMVKHEKAMDAVKQHLSKPFGILLDEVNSYSIDFAVMWQVRNDPDIVCFGVVYHRNTTKVALKIAGRVIKKPVMLSDNFDEVQEWMKSQMASSN